MHLSPSDTEKLLLSVAGMVARDRLDRGVRLNYPEAVALLSTWVIERAREGAGVAELMESGRAVLSRDQVMPARTSGPGAMRIVPGTITLNDRRDDERIELVIVNAGDRPVQIGSHLHLPDANAALEFDRAAAHGFRLDIPSGTSQRFEPGASRQVAAVALRGDRRVPGIQIKTEDGVRLDG